MLDGLARLVEIVAGVKHALDPAGLGPLLDLVVIAVVRREQIVRFFVGPGPKGAVSPGLMEPK
jgi:hypothetical protein